MPSNEKLLAPVLPPIMNSDKLGANALNPWVEKYRPKIFEHIVLDSMNKDILMSVVNAKTFPNLLFYGPPGTGKTTTIINVIDLFQKTHNEVSRANIIHLNASDDRGIEIVRNQIQQFATSNTLYNNGMKFVVLDEVDYMTKNAQQALKYLIENNNENVRFCLICNYISRIDQALQEHFILLRFNKFPEMDVVQFLRSICDNEKLNVTTEVLMNINKIYKSDIRSMINYIQSNQYSLNTMYSIKPKDWDALLKTIREKRTIKPAITAIHNMAQSKQCVVMEVITELLNHIIETHPDLINPELLSLFKYVIHSANDDNDEIIVKYVVMRLRGIWRGSE